MSLEIHWYQQLSDQLGIEWVSKWMGFPLKMNNCRGFEGSKKIAKKAHVTLLQELLHLADLFLITQAIKTTDLTHQIKLINIFALDNKYCH